MELISIKIMKINKLVEYTFGGDFLKGVTLSIGHSTVLSSLLLLVNCCASVSSVAKTAISQ